MRALVIDEQAKQDIANLLKYADKNRISKPFLLAAAAAMNGGNPAVGDIPQHCCHFRDGFKVVLSIEQQPNGWCKHLSVSVDNPEKLPSIEAVKMIIEEFGMKSLDDSNVYIEETTPKAVNIISLI